MPKGFLTRRILYLAFLQFLVRPHGSFPEAAKQMPQYVGVGLRCLSIDGSEVILPMGAGGTAFSITPFSSGGRGQASGLEYGEVRL